MYSAKIGNTTKRGAGFLAAVSAFFLLYVLPVFSAGIVTDCEGSSCTFGSLVKAVQAFIDFLMYDLTAPVAVILLLWAGWIYLTAGPNPGKTEKAISIFNSVIVGIIIMFSAWLIVHFITDELLKDAFKKGVEVI